jgi:hypothetical protein
MDQTSYNAMDSNMFNATNAKEIDEKREELKSNIKKSTNKHRKETLAPMMEEEGWKTNISKDGTVTFKKNGKESTKEDEAVVFVKVRSKQMVKDEAKDFTDSAISSVKSFGDESFTGMQKQIDDLKKRIEDYATSSKENINKIIPQTYSKENKEVITQEKTTREKTKQVATPKLNIPQIITEESQNITEPITIQNSNNISDSKENKIIDGNPLGVRNINPIVNQILRSAGGTL